MAAAYCTKEGINGFSLDSNSMFYAENAVQALIEEVDLTPKPGLVDKRNNGSHIDMNRTIFHKSAYALYDYFRKAFEIGYQFAGNYECCMNYLVQYGIEAEKCMYSATKGVNTHKGMIFSLGIILAACSSAYRNQESIRHLCVHLASEKKDADRTGTHGEAVLDSYGAKGIIKEARSGYPHAFSAAKIISNCQKQGTDPDEARLRALVWIMTSLEDTNVLYRAGLAGSEYVRKGAESCLQLHGESFIKALEKLDDCFIEKNISPGGSADMLALAIFLDKMKDKWAMDSICC